MPVAPKPYLGLRVAPKKTDTTTKLLIDDCPEAYAAPSAVGTSPARGDLPNPEEQPPQLPGPAFAAGLRVGDELLRFANYVVTDLASFNAIVARHAKTGQQVPVQYKRGASIQTAVIVVGSK
jgi:S1-C subfamily serine protease